MKTKIFKIASVLSLVLTSGTLFAQTIDLGSASNFVLFSTDGAVSNTGISQLTGNVGTNNGSSTNFGNVNGLMCDANLISAQCAVDVLIAYNQINTTIPAFFPAPLLGNGQILTAGVYAITGATTLNLDLTLDAQGDPNAEFIFQISGPLSTNASSKIILKNGAQACHVFWKVEGLVDMASGTTFRGTIIANNAAINFNTGDTLEGRALTTAGAITIDGMLAYTPIGCGSPVLTGPSSPDLGVAGCYSIFSSVGAVTNSGVSTIIGDVGSDNGATSGFNASDVSGTIHLVPDVSTAQCAADLLVAYNYLNSLTYDIELLYPAQFGANLVLTPHTYLLDGAVTFTDSLYLNAQGNANAIFVIQVNGALSTSTYSRVLLINGTQAKNVYWKIEGAVNINDYSVFCGTIISNNGALGAINTGVFLYGRALTTNGALSTTAISVVATDIPANCGNVGLTVVSTNDAEIAVYPNPFGNKLTIDASKFSAANSLEVVIYNVLGEVVLRKTLTSKTTNLETSALYSGMYFYEVYDNLHLIQSGKIVSEQ